MIEIRRGKHAVRFGILADLQWIQHGCQIQPASFGADDDPLGVLQHNAHEGAKTCGACADDEDRVFRGDLADARGPEAGGQHIPHQQRLRIGDRVRDFVQTLVSIGHTDKFGLSAVNAATQRPAAVGVGAVVDEALSAEEALPAEGLHIHRHPVARFDRSYIRTHSLSYERY